MDEIRTANAGPDPAGVFAGLARKKVYIETYGCRYNFGDTANLIAVLRHYGSTLVSGPEEADAVVVNTCTVVGPTERRMLRRLSALQGKPLFVTGCMPLVQREAVLAVCSPVIIPPDTIREASRALTEIGTENPGIIQIAQGCLGRCTYCITRRARGPLRSFPVQEIREKVRTYAGTGIYEIQLTAQDTSAWGRDTGQCLPDLLSGNYHAGCDPRSLPLP